MKKTSVSIMYEDEKLNAVKMYMEQRDLDFKEELEKSVDSLYAKYVPANVREFIDMKGSQVKPPKPKNQRLKVRKRLEVAKFWHRNRNDRHHSQYCGESDCRLFSYRRNLCRRLL